MASQGKPLGFRPEFQVNLKLGLNPRTVDADAGVARPDRHAGYLHGRFHGRSRAAKKGGADEQAVKAFEPYKQVQEPNPGVREAMRKIAERAWKTRQPAYVFVNNRLEGNVAGDDRGGGGRDRGLEPI